MDRIEKFYRKNFKRLTGFIKQYTDGSYDIASDIVQMVFLRLARIRTGRENKLLRGMTPFPFFYVYRSCINTALKYQRAKKRIQKVDIDDLENHSYETYPEERDAMEKLILI